MNSTVIIEIPSKSAHWRADQIAGIELSSNSLFIFPINTPERNVGYVYNKAQEAEQAYKKVVNEWRAAIEGPKVP